MNKLKHKLCVCDARFTKVTVVLVEEIAGREWRREKEEEESGK